MQMYFAICSFPPLTLKLDEKVSLGFLCPNKALTKKKTYFLPGQPNKELVIFSTEA